MPGIDKGNLFLEGSGFFVTKTLNGKTVYTRRGEFSFDSEGYYKATDGKRVQGYILDTNGQLMAPTITSSDPYSATSKGGGPDIIPTTDIKLWLDPANGKFLGILPCGHSFPILGPILSGNATAIVSDDQRLDGLADLVDTASLFGTATFDQMSSEIFVGFIGG